MKKTLITLLALAGVAFAQGTEIAFTTTNAISTRASSFNSKGFILSLNDATALTTTSTLTGTSLSRYVELQSITLITGATSGSANGTFSLVITDTDFKIVGWSTSVTTASTSNTLSFKSGIDTPVVLDTTKDYLFLADSATSFTLGNTLAATTNEVRYGSNGVTDYGAGKLDFDGSTSGSYSGFQCISTTETNGVYTGYTTTRMVNSGGSQTDAYARFAPTITIQTKLVPEPTTATLSLLALAGLAARRRRRSK